MKIIAPFKFWLKAVEIFFLQIPCFLISLYFAGIASILISVAGYEDTSVNTITFWSIFVLSNTLLFANYCDWGKSSDKKTKRFLPSQTGLIEGSLMTLIAIATNFLIILFIPAPQTRLIGYELGALLARFEHLSFGTIFFLALWLYIASYLLYCISLTKFIKK